MIGSEFDFVKMKGCTSLSNYFEKLRNHKRIVPLLRGRVHVLNIFIYTYSYFMLKNKDLPPEFKYAYGVVYFVSIVSSIIIAWYHNSVLDLKTRAMFKRVDYAVIFFSIVSPWFPIHLYYAKDGFTTAFVLVHWSLALIGAVTSLLYDFYLAPKWVRVGLFNLCGQLNWYVGYKTYTSGRIEEFYYFLIGTTCYFLSGLVYAAKYPNPVSRIFEHHEVMHLLVTRFLTLNQMIIPLDKFGVILSKFQNHNRDVPLLRGKLHYLQFVHLLLLLKYVKNKNLPLEIRYSVLVFMICIVTNMIGSSLLHNNQLYIYRSAYKRIDYAGIFLIVTGEVFPLYIHYMKEDRVVAILAAMQWTMTFTGVFASLVFDFCCIAREVRSIIFFLTSSPNAYVMYKMFVCGDHLTLSCIIASYLVNVCATMIYCKEGSYLKNKVFEFHELFHTVCFLSCGLVILANNSVIKLY